MGHLLLDLEGLEADWTLTEITNLFSKLSETLNLHVVSACSHQFTPCGVSHILLLAESHFTIHTFPEERKANLDLYCCSKDFCFERALDELTKAFPSKEVKAHIIYRN